MPPPRTPRQAASVFPSLGSAYRRYVNAVGYRRVAHGTVLVVEDNDVIRHLVTVLLERAGLHVRGCSDGHDALRILFAERPDAVVLDIGLPGLDGWQVLDRVRELSDVPVLMLTAYGAELDKVRGLRAGADDFVTKPSGARSSSPGSRRCCAARALGRRRAARSTSTPTAR